MATFFLCRSGYAIMPMTKVKSWLTPISPPAKNRVHRTDTALFAGRTHPPADALPMAQSKRRAPKNKILVFRKIPQLGCHRVTAYEEEVYGGCFPPGLWSCS
jgi:hypothetical protein